MSKKDRIFIYDVYLSGKGKSEHGNKGGAEAEKTKGNNGGEDKQGKVETSKENKDEGGDKVGGEVEKGSADGRSKWMIY